MALIPYGANSTVVPSCNYTTENFFRGVPKVCGQYIKTLEICPDISVTPAVRLHAANQTAYCMEAFWQKSWYNGHPEYGLNYTNEDPVAIKADPGCHYPDFLPILQRTCSYDLGRLDNSCYSSFNNTGLSRSNIFTDCQTEAAIQYVRCTLQKSTDKVASCVADNAVKVDWLPQIQSYTGAKSCKNADVYLVSQGIRILLHVLLLLLKVFGLSKLIQAARSRFKSLPEPANGPDFDIWVREKRYTLKANRLLQSIGREVLTAYLIVIVSSESRVFTTSSFNELISFYVVRPRPAPFVGLLGLFKPWSKEGLAELVVDGLLSFVAGTNVASRYWGLVNHPPSNPAAPASDLKTLAVGAIMTCIPAFAVLVITFLISMGMVADSDKKRGRKRKDDDCASLIAGLCIWSLWLTAIAVFICLLPLVAIFEMVAAVVVMIRGKLKKRKNKEIGSDDDIDSWLDRVRQSRWLEPLTTTSGKFRVLYALFVLSSFVINVGNWLFFASYLKLDGEMYCPTKSNQIIAMWILVPFGIDLFFSTFRFWTKDTYFHAQARQDAGQEMPPPL